MSLLKFKPSKYETGFQNFDQITGGGLPKASAVALIGTVDSEKILFARQIVWHLLQLGAQILYYSVSQSAEELRYDMSSYGWDCKPYEEENLLRIVDVFTEATEKIKESGFNIKDIELDNIETNDNLANMEFHKAVYDFNLVYREGVKFMPPVPSIRRRVFRVAIFDSISPFLTINADGVFQMIHTLKFATRLTKATGIGVMHTKIHQEKTEETFKSLADAIFEVNKIKTGISNYLLIRKYPGTFRSGPFPLERTTQGVNIIPIEMPELMGLS